MASNDYLIGTTQGETSHRFSHHNVIGRSREIVVRRLGKLVIV